MEFASAHLRCSVQIDLCAIERNLKRVRNFLPKEKSYIASVPADAFGIGISAAVAYLMQSGADAFAVSNLNEALQVREIGFGWPIIVMCASIPGEEIYYFENFITPVISSLEEVERFEAMGEKLSKTLSVQMRLPSSVDNVPSVQDAKKILEKLAKSSYLKLDALCAIGTGSGSAQETNNCDLEFLNYASGFFKEGKMILCHDDLFDLKCLPKNFDSALRLGLVLFGIQPEKNSILTGFVPEQVLSFKSAISQIKTLQKGANIGYGKTYTLPYDTRIALISAGYGDGMTRNISPDTCVLVRGNKLKIIGRVSMDQACIDTTPLKEISIDDEVILIGRSANEIITIEDYCKNMGISPAQALCSITRRVIRYYKKLS